MREEYVSLTMKTETDLITKARNVYAHLTDDISKKVFEARILFAMTGDVGTMTELGAHDRNLSSDMEVYASKLHKGDHCILCGVGGGAQYLLRRFRYLGIYVDALLNPDADEASMDEKTGLRILSYRDLQENIALYSNQKYVMAISDSHRAAKVTQMLCGQIGIPQAQVTSCLYDLRNNTSQYFDYFEARENEVFVDCGCYDGGTCYRFAGWCGNKGYEQIYSFEADPANYENCKKLLAPLGKCELFPYGTARERGKVYFASRSFEDSCIISEDDARKMNYEGVTQIETISLDEALEGKRITFLKMDIEGAEYDALLGAEKLIRENHPRMAISIYHKPEDIILLADLVLQMHPDYQIAFRHYGWDDLETIMYVD